MTPIRVLIFTIVPSPYQRDLFAALHAREEIELKVVYFEDASPDSPWPKKALADYESILPGRWFPIGPVRWHVHQQIPSVVGWDIVVVNGFTSSTAQKLMRSKLRDKKWIFWGERMRKQTSRWKDRVQRWLTKPLFNATAIAAIGSRAMWDYQARFRRVRVRNMPYHCDLEIFRQAPRSPSPDGAVRFLFCGQIIARKGVDTLMDAFEQVIATGADARLILAGREGELQEFLASLSPEAGARVEYRGFKAPEDLPSVFADADVFVLPSRYDGWGVVVNQALGAGLPIICSDAVGAGADLVKPNVNGWIFETHKSHQLAKAMLEAAGSPELREQFGKNSAIASADWTPERGAERFMEIFQEVHSA